MQRKIISTESKWFISQKPRNQANELIRMRMPTWLRLADSFLRIFNLHIDKNFSPVTSNLVFTDTQVAKELWISRLYGQLNDENHFEIYYELFKLIQPKPSASTVTEGLLALADNGVYHLNTFFPANVLSAKNRFIGYLSTDDFTVTCGNNNQFELKGLTIGEANKLQIVKTGLYLFQFYKDETGKLQMSATEIIWNSEKNRLVICGIYYPDFRLMPEN